MFMFFVIDQLLERGREAVRGAHDQCAFMSACLFCVAALCNRMRFINAQAFE
jgi:hypothetical protein